MNKSYFRWVLLGCTALMICAFTPQIIEFIYSKNGFCFTVTTFSKEELLSFYGSFLSFIGTIFLGALALWQNINISKMAIEQEILKSRAFFTLVSVVDYKKHTIAKTNDKRDEEDVYIFNGDVLDLNVLEWNVQGAYNYGLIPQQILTSVILKNVGGNYAHCVKLYFQIDNTRLFWGKITAIAVGEEIIFYPLYSDLTHIKDKTLQLIIEFKDMFNNNYSQSINVRIIGERLAFTTDSYPV